MNNHDFCTDSPIHPKEQLKETLEAKGITQTELANRLGISRKVVNEMVGGKNPITPQTAILLERVLETPAHVWNNLQRNYDLNVAYLEEKKRIEDDCGVLNKFPIQLMGKYGWIPQAKSNFDKTKILYNFFGIASLKNVEYSVSIKFRRSLRDNVSKEALIAWLRKGELEVNAMSTEAYSKSGLYKILPNLRDLTNYGPEVFQSKIVELCSNVGVAVVFIPELPNTFVNGATFWVNNQKAAILLSLRFKTNDHLWFSFFHELGHILLHAKRSSFVDLEKMSIEHDIPEESEANEFASDWLISRQEWRRFRDQTPFSAQGVLKLAAKLAIAPGIVVGRLQREGLIPYSHLNGLKIRMRWAQE